MRKSEGWLGELSGCQQAEGEQRGWGRKSNAGWRRGKNLVKAKELRRTQGVVGEQEEFVRDSGKISSA